MGTIHVPLSPHAAAAAILEHFSLNDVDVMARLLEEAIERRASRATDR